jgi:serine/threonine protein kinase
VSDVRLSHPSSTQLAAYATGQLDEFSAAAVRSHLEVCETCRAARGTLPPQNAIADLAAHPAEPATISPPSSERTDTPSAHEAPTRAPDSPSLDPASPDVPSALVDHPRYRVLKLLGIGGMGAVYKAEHRLMERAVALKVMSRSLLDNPGAVERFRLEVKAAAKLAHPHIVTAYDAEQVGDLHFLVMEFVEGVSLGEYIRRRGPLPVLYACDFVRQAALGLQHAFEQKMVHRDIKPPNLMLTPKWKVKILDFGLARFVSESNKAGLTAVGIVMGTPDFIAPEQAEDSRKADIRADLYSLGCTFYYLLTGQPPFPEGSAIQKILGHLERDPAPVTSFRDDVPPEVVQVLNRLMAKDPARRYQTPVEAAKALLAILKPATTESEKERATADSEVRSGRETMLAEPVAVLPDEPAVVPSKPPSRIRLEEAPRRRAKPRRRRPDTRLPYGLILGGLGAAVLLALVVFGGILWHRARMRSPIDGTPPGAPPGWVEFKPPSGDFRVFLPRQPDRSGSIARFGKVENLVTWTAREQVQTYTVKYGDLQGANEVLHVDEVFNGLGNALVVAGQGRQLVDDQPIKLDTHPGRRYQVAAGMGRTLWARAYVVGQRLYLLEYEAPALGPEAETFFASFKLTGNG